MFSSPPCFCRVGFSLCNYFPNLSPPNSLLYSSKPQISLAKPLLNTDSPGKPLKASCFSGLPHPSPEILWAVLSLPDTPTKVFQEDLVCPSFPCSSRALPTSAVSFSRQLLAVLCVQRCSRTVRLRDVHSSGGVMR